MQLKYILLQSYLPIFVLVSDIKGPRDRKVCEHATAFHDLTVAVFKRNSDKLMSKPIDILKYNSFKTGLTLMSIAHTRQSSLSLIS